MENKKTPSPEAHMRGCTCHPDDNPPVPCAQRYALSECRAAPHQTDVMVPEGYALVPIEPTREMWAAMADTLYGYKNRHHDKVAGDLYKAMLEAALPPPQSREAGNAILYERTDMGEAS